MAPRDETKLADLNLPTNTHLVLHVRVPQEAPPPAAPKEALSPLPALPQPAPAAGSPAPALAGGGAAGGPLFAPQDVQNILHNLSLQFGVAPPAGSSLTGFCFC